jgi:hypothetical protein
MAAPAITSLLTDLSVAGSTPAPNRLIVAVDGLDKHGKTTFALSAPKPLVYLDFDIGKEGVIEKVPDAQRILVSKPFMFRASEAGWDAPNDAERTKAIMEAADPELDRFRRTYLKALTEPIIAVNGVKQKARSVVIDTGSEAWELMRQCYFGKLTQVKPHHYGEVNGLMRDLVRAGYESDVNVIWLHKLKSEWKEGADNKRSKSGVLERTGFSDMSYLVQANLLAYRVGTTPQTVKWRSGEGTFEVTLDPRQLDAEGYVTDDDLGFRIVCGNSRHNATLEGEVWEGLGATFPAVAAAITGTPVRNWM